MLWWIRVQIWSNPTDLNGGTAGVSENCKWVWPRVWSGLVGIHFFFQMNLPQTKAFFPPPIIEPVSIGRQNLPAIYALSLFTGCSKSFWGTLHWIWIPDYSGAFPELLLLCRSTATQFLAGCARRRNHVGSGWRTTLIYSLLYKIFCHFLYFPLTLLSLPYQKNLWLFCILSVISLLFSFIQVNDKKRSFEKHKPDDGLWIRMSILRSHWFYTNAPHWPQRSYSWPTPELWVWPSVFERSCFSQLNCTQYYG